MAHNDKSGPNESPLLPGLSYKINEAAKILGVSPITIRRAISRGLLKPCRAFRHPLISAEQLKKLFTPREDIVWRAGCLLGLAWVLVICNTSFMAIKFQFNEKKAVQAAAY